MVFNSLAQVVANDTVRMQFPLIPPILLYLPLPEVVLENLKRVHYTDNTSPIRGVINPIGFNFESEPGSFWIVGFTRELS